MTPEQMRTARGMLNWARDRLAEKAGVQVKTLLMAESGRTTPRPRTLAAIRATLEAAGVEFNNEDAPGVRLRQPGA